MQDEFAAYAVARRMIHDHGPDALKVALEVAAMPCLQQFGESVQLWRDVAEAVSRLQAERVALLEEPSIARLSPIVPTR